MKFDLENIVRFVVLGIMMLLLTHSSIGKEDEKDVVAKDKTGIEDSRVVAKE